MSRPFAIALASAALVAALAGGRAAAVEAVADTLLVMHLGPGAEHRSVGTVPAEAHLTVHGCIQDKGWCMVRHGGRHGWVEGGSLSVIGFSRPPPQPAAAPGAQQVLVVPVPLAPAGPLASFTTADDVVIEAGENVGRAAFLPRTGGKDFGVKKRHRSEASFKQRKGRHDMHRRGHGRPHHKHLDGRGFHGDKELRFRRELRFETAHFGKGGHFVHRGRSGGDHRLHFGKGHSKHGVGKRGRSFQSSGKFRFTGHRVKGGWRP